MFVVNIPGNFFCDIDRSNICHAAYKIFGTDSTGTIWGATPSQVISSLLPNFIVIAGVIFFIWIIIAGWGVVMSAGEEGSAQDKAKAKAALTYAVVGFLLVVSAYFILQVIGVVTGIDFINPII